MSQPSACSAACIAIASSGTCTASRAAAWAGVAEWRALRGDADSETATSKATLGAALLDQGKLDEAERVLSDALRTHEATSHALAVASTLTLVGALAVTRADLPKARASCERALSLTRGFYPDTHSEVQELLGSLRALGE